MERNVDTDGQLRSARVMLAWSCMLIAACTPIGKVRHSTDGGAITALEPGSCQEDGDCVVHSPCLAVHCQNGKCAEQPELEGTIPSADLQQPGDCTVQVCDGKGLARNRNDDTDVPPPDDNPCRSVTCVNGQPKYADLPDTTVCNTTGTCGKGMCSTCDDDKECSRSDDCTVRRFNCKTGSCEDTGVPRQATCSAGKVCSGGSCVPCIVGADCQLDNSVCQRGRISKCEGGLICEPVPLSGPTCGSDEMGRTMYCMAGMCTRACRDGSCMASNSTNPCQEGRWDCTNSNAPSCIMAAVDDGTGCGDGMSCHAGTCVHSALINGDFSDGWVGWTATDDGTLFRVGPDAAYDNRPTLSTSSDGSSTGGALAGTLSQAFTVPDDALALRFTISGGHAHVRLKDASGNVLQECAGRDDTNHIGVSWELGGYRGQRLQIAIEDDVTSGDWAFVTTSGFDVIRELDAPIRNPQFLQNLDGWETTGDGLHFYVFDTYNYFVGGLTSAPEYGQRRCITTYTRDMSNDTMGSTSQGTVTQMFIVPPDAVALRFAVHGGSMGSVELQYQSQTVYTVSALDDDATMVWRSWDLTPYRGKAVRLSVVDTTSLPPYGYIGTTGFDLITSYNGP